MMMIIIVVALLSLLHWLDTASFFSIRHSRIGLIMASQIILALYSLLWLLFFLVFIGNIINRIHYSNGSVPFVYSFFSSFGSFFISIYIYILHISFYNKTIKLLSFFFNSLYLKETKHFFTWFNKKQNKHFAHTVGICRVSERLLQCRWSLLSLLLL